MSEITNTDDIIDSRDVIERIDELEMEQADALAGNSDLTIDEWEAEGHGDELDNLRALALEGESFEDWPDGVALIRDSYFVDHARELADDIGAIDANASWPLSYTDWEQAADELRMNYSAVTFAGVTYWAR